MATKGKSAESEDPVSAKSKSKAEKERLKKEEEERKAREEEEERQRLLEEEKERKRREKQEAIERAKRERELAILRTEEYSELKVKLAQITNDLIKHQEQVKEAQEWDRYVRCDGTPDPTILGQINTYINLNREEETAMEMKTALDKNHLTLALIDELFYKIRQAASTKGQRTKQLMEQYHSTIIQLQSLISDYIDNATLETLEKAVYMADKDSGNLQTVSKNEEVIVALWANLAKNAKIRSFMFEEEGVGFEIPRNMATSDISLRFVLTKYDHHSYRATSTPPMRKWLVMPELPETPVADVPEEAPGATDRQMSETERTTGAPEDPVMALLGGSPVPNEQDEAGLTAEGANQNEENGSANERIEDAANEQNLKDGEGKPDMKSGTDAEEEDVPPVDPYAGDDTVINLHQWAPIYGVLYIDLLSVPPQPITANGWIMKQVVAKKLQRIDFKDYTEMDIQASQTGQGAGAAGGSMSPDMTSAVGGGPTESNIGGADGQSVPPPQNEAEASSVGQGAPGNDSVTAASVSQSVMGGQSGTASKHQANVAGGAGGSKENSTVKILFKLPDSVCIPEMEIQVGRWNEDKKCWKIDGISDVAYDKENNLLSWKTSVFGAFCCFQDSYVNMPLQQWEMRPKDTNNVLITIISTVAEIELEIKDDKCRLNYHEDREQAIKELKPLCGDWIEPLEVVDRLTSIGINIFPESYSHEYVSICEKDLESEKFVYQQMALVASGVSFAWSRFNAEEILSRDQIVIQAHDELQSLNETGEEDWCLLLLGREQMCKLAIDEFAETFSTDVAQGQQVHFDMVHLVKPWVCEKSMQRVEESSPIFIDTVYQMLMATKLITFS
ncbi:dynein axonemal intermediate chain 7 homolog isoform X2 [Convolutriloba macropyga]|uniref:dynein axonemal intermediate chain 7 homolog isoform X2 n=1 Tax=Convolutriloba macropyga TaxID=536237 RepID=UPI003F51E9FC